MPCTYAGSLEGDRALIAETALTEVTEMLCKCCQQLEANDVEIPRGVKRWWREHKKREGRN